MQQILLLDIQRMRGDLRHYHVVVDRGAMLAALDAIEELVRDPTRDIMLVEPLLHRIGKELRVSTGEYIHADDCECECDCDDC